MIRIGKESKRSPDRVLQEAKAFFGPNGLGLELAAEDACRLSLQGGGGFVTVEVCASDGRTQVDVTSREWEQAAREFIGRV